MVKQKEIDRLKAIQDKKDALEAKMREESEMRKARMIKKQEYNEKVKNIWLKKEEMCR